jgi:hypothetical protein
MARDTNVFPHFLPPDLNINASRNPAAKENARMRSGGSFSSEGSDETEGARERISRACFEGAHRAGVLYVFALAGYCLGCRLGVKLCCVG